MADITYIVSLAPIRVSLCVNLSDEELVRIMATCKSLYCSIIPILHDRDIDKVLSHLIPAPALFRDLLRETNTVLIGGLVNEYTLLNGPKVTATIFNPEYTRGGQGVHGHTPFITMEDHRATGKIAR